MSLTKLNKEQLFEHFYQATCHTLLNLEAHFSIANVLTQVVGANENADAQKTRLKASYAWDCLSKMFDFSVDGYLGDQDPLDLIINGRDVLNLVSFEVSPEASPWTPVLEGAEARLCLEEQRPMHAYHAALLANVDIRTVRNAMSAGELRGTKADGETLIDIDSARAWLLGRKGYRPTIRTADTQSTLSDQKTPERLGAYLKMVREQRIGMDFDQDERLGNLGLKPIDIQEIESGIFRKPIDHAKALADYYCIPRGEFLWKVMELFFYEEMSLLKGE